MSESSHNMVSTLLEVIDDGALTGDRYDRYSWTHATDCNECQLIKGETNE